MLSTCHVGSFMPGSLGQELTHLTEILLKRSLDLHVPEREPAAQGLSHEPKAIELLSQWRGISIYSCLFEPEILALFNCLGEGLAPGDRKDSILSSLFPSVSLRGWGKE